MKLLVAIAAQSCSIALSSRTQRLGGGVKGKIPVEEKLEDKTTIEQVKLISDLDPEDKAMVFRLIDTIVTKKKFKDFFQQNVTQ